MTGAALVVVLVALAVSRRSVFAAEYNVVGDGGCPGDWTYACKYDSWANSKLLVGDILVFHFDSSGMNTVAIVSEFVYSTCGSGVSSIPGEIYNISPKRFNLTLGDHYFVSIYSFICFQKLYITVGSSSPTTTPTPPTPDAPSGTTPMPPTLDAPSGTTPTPPTLDAPSGTTSMPTTKSPSTPPPSKSNEGTIIGAVTGALIGVAVLVAKIWLITYCMQRRKNRHLRLNNDQIDMVATEFAKPPM